MMQIILHKMMEKNMHNGAEQKKNNKNVTSNKKKTN